MNKVMENTLNAIARSSLQLESLASSQDESLNVHSLHVSKIREALQKAYLAGVKVGMKP